MKILLTALSVLAGWSLLGTIAGGLLLILKPLEAVRSSMRKITMGVRAIEDETRPLGPGAATLITSLGGAADSVGSATQRLAAISRDLDAVAGTLKARTGRGGDGHA